ncbi:hypothetical protein CMI37_31665 [Candidatus Pacearchaeota archaeon]|nr:hypothetical protein [Candidatus Pacearchaeota archaeon]|tara:strand:- start:4892 stop:5422 length:531 start_codon:yes stop_codon:yes gene_type:complete
MAKKVGRPKKEDQAVAPVAERKPSKDLIVGDTVLFFEKGDMDQKPVASIVLDIAGNGCLELATIPKYANEFVRRQNVHHYKDSAREEIIDRYGTWSSRDEEVNRRRAQHARDVRLTRLREESMAKLAKQDDDRTKILKLYDKGQNTEQIESQLTGWTKLQIAELIQNRAEPITQPS